VIQLYGAPKCIIIVFKVRLEFRFRRWFDISTDATPTFLEHTMHLVLPDAKGNKAEMRMEESKA